MMQRQMGGQQQPNQAQFANQGMNSPHSPATAPFPQSSPNTMRSPYGHMNSPQPHQQGPGGPQQMQSQPMGPMGNQIMNFKQQQMMGQGQFPNGGAAMYGGYSRMNTPFNHQQDGGNWGTNGYGGQMGQMYGQQRFMGHQGFAGAGFGAQQQQQQQQFMQMQQQQQQQQGHFGGMNQGPGNQQQQHHFANNFGNNAVGGGGGGVGGGDQFGNAMGGGPGGNFNAPMGGMPPGMAMHQHQRMGMMGAAGDMSSQPIPPNFRGAAGGPMTSPMGGAPGMGNGMANSPRISPSAMHKPMPGVGMPKVSPAAVNPSINSRQTTPLVSPQSDHSPASHNPLTPASSHGPLTPQHHHHQQQQQQQPYGGPGSNGGMHAAQHPGQVSPMMNNPRTPQSVGSYNMQQQRSVEMPKPSASPMSGGQPHSHQHMHEDTMISPNSNMASNLRKIRRPSKPNQDVPMTSPAPAPASNAPEVKQEVKEEIKEEARTPAAVPQPEAVKEEPAQEPEPEPDPKFEARWEELPEKAVKRILEFCVANDGAVPFLIRASKVCKKWHEVTKDKSIWTHLDLSSGRLKEKYRNDKKIEDFLKRYPNVKEVKLTGWKNSVSTSTLKILASVCPNIVSLGLASCFKLTNEDLKYIGEHFPKLERLDLSNVSVSDSRQISIFMRA